MSTEFSPARSSTEHKNPTESSFDLDALADRGEKRLRDHLREGYDREPSAEEVEWVRDFPRRIAEDRDGKDPRPPTLTEMRNHFGWGPSEAEKERWGEDFAEQQQSGPNLTYK